MSKSEDGKLKFPEDVSPEEYAKTYEKTSESYQSDSEKPPEKIIPEGNTKPSEGYEVGYKKPPKRTQFQKGVPSVRKGKKKKKGYYYDEIFWQIAREKVGVRIGNKTVRMSRIEACIRRQAQQALSGDQRALTHYLGTFASNSANKQEQGAKEYIRRIMEEKDEDSAD